MRSVAIIGLVSLVMAAITQEWLVAVELATLGIGLWLLAPLTRYPLLPVAVVAEWVAVTSGPLYLSFTGRRIPELRGFDPSLVVTVGCAALVAQFIGLRIGFRLGSRPDSPKVSAELPPLPMVWLLGLYVAMSLLHGVSLRFGMQILAVAQIVLAVDAFRLVVLFVLVSRLLQRPNGGLAVALIAFIEVVVVPFGWMADFLPALVLLAAAVFSHLRLAGMTPRRWLAASAAVGALVVLMVMWTGIKPGLRHSSGVHGPTAERSRLTELTEAGANWFVRGTWKHDSDALVSRVWALYYPGLAYRRMPASVAHTDGSIVLAALQHIVTPRFLFPDKPTTLDADSNEVRRYAGVWVAGSKQRTSMGFGRFGESFVDFGSVGVIVLELLFGILLALSLGQISGRLVHPELRLAVNATLSLTLCGMQASWVMTLGPTVMAFLVVGLGSLVIDRYVENLAQKKWTPGLPAT